MPIKDPPHPGDFIRTDGTAYREGLRREDGHADADAVRLRYRANAQAGEGNSCPDVSIAPPISILKV